MRSRTPRRKTGREKGSQKPRSQEARIEDAPFWLLASGFLFPFLRGFFLFARRKREIERCAFVRFGFGPNATFVAIDDALDSSEPDSSTLEFIGGMQTLKSTEELLRMLHVETHPIVAHEVDVFPGAG